MTTALPGRHEVRVYTQQDIAHWTVMRCTKGDWSDWIGCQHRVVVFSVARVMTSYAYGAPAKPRGCEATGCHSDITGHANSRIIGYERLVARGMRVVTGGTGLWVNISGSEPQGAQFCARRIAIVTVVCRALQKHIHAPDGSIGIR